MAGTPSSTRRSPGRCSAVSRRLAPEHNVLAQADVRRHPHSPLIDTIWSLRQAVSAYDATYLALASVLDAPLVTTDRKLASLSGLPCAVEIL